MKNWLQRQIRRVLVKKILGMVDAEDILLIESERDRETGRVFTKVTLGGQELDTHSRDILREEANRFNNSFLWKLLLRHIKWQAIQQAFSKDDLKGGQDIMLTLRLIQDLVDDIQKKV